MKRTVALACVMLAACSGGSGASPQPGPAPTPTPSPSPTPSPTPTPTPSPSYTKFADLFADRSFQSACGGFILQGQPPAVLPPTPFGQGLTFSYLSTPQIQNIGGDGLSLSFGPSNVDASAPVGVTAYVKGTGADTERFSISRPAPNGVGLDYARLASVSVNRNGAQRLYQCVIGVPTLTTDLPDVTVGGGVYPRAVLGGSGYLRDTATARQYSLARSTVTFAADFSVRRATLTLVLIGTPLDAPGPDVPFGTFTGSGEINRLTGNFTGTLNGQNRAGTGSFSGRFFGPQVQEFGLSLGITGPETGSQLAYSVAATAFGSRVLP
jgi:hypothetical protein